MKTGPVFTFYISFQLRVGQRHRARCFGSPGGGRATASHFALEIWSIFYAERRWRDAHQRRVWRKPRSPQCQGRHLYRWELMILVGFEKLLIGMSMLGQSLIRLHTSLSDSRMIFNIPIFEVPRFLNQWTILCWGQCGVARFIGSKDLRSEQVQWKHGKQKFRNTSVIILML